jgi:hypothetical protein
MPFAVSLHRRAITLLLVAAVLAPGLPVQAQPGKEPTSEELAAARQLFNEALELEKDNDWATALTKFDRVAQVKMTPQVRFHQALCHEHLGHLVQAVNGFELAIQEARAASITDVLEQAPKRAEALRKRLGHVVLHVKGKVRTSKILIDDGQVSLALADTRIPVDPGPHRVEVKRDDEVTFSQEIDLAEGETHELDLDIDDPEPPPPPPPPPPIPIPDPGGPSETPPSRIPAYATMAVGGVILTASGILFGLREATIANVRCDDPKEFTGCDPDDQGTADLAQSYDIASKVLLGIGGAALAAGAVWWIVLATDGSNNTTGVASPRVSVVPLVGGIAAFGSF